MVPGTVLFVSATYLVMLAAFALARYRHLHQPVMASIILIDLAFPFYLVSTRDWGKRLIEQGEILSFLIWMHLILVMTLYMLYGLQVLTARKMRRGQMEVKPDHRTQGFGILVTRALVILSGALLAEPVSK